jgi:large subunit ribosomal protein L22
MGSRKEKSADARKEANKELYIAKLNNCPTSPRKMRLVADLVRGMDVVSATNTLQFTSKEAARRVEKLLHSAMNNFEQKSGEKWENANLFIKEIKVDSGRMLKRLQPAPQGRAHRIRKRSNHVTLVVDSKQIDIQQ